MTHAEHAGHQGTRQEEDRISTPRILAVGIASLVIFTVGGVAVGLHWQRRVAEAHLPPTPAEAGRSKIGMVEQQLFEVANRGERDRATRLERLGAYGWVDRRTGVAHMPIDRAMELVEQGVRARGGGAPPAREPGGQP